MLGQMNKITLQTHMLYVLKGNCQSGSWKAQRPTRTKTIAASVWSCSNELSSYPDAPYYIYGSDSHYQVASKAQCTSGTLVGGGHELMYYVPKIDRGISGNSPDASFPLGNEWLVIAGGFPSGCFRAFALCAEQFFANPVSGAR